MVAEDRGVDRRRAGLRLNELRVRQDLRRPALEQPRGALPEWCRSFFSIGMLTAARPVYCQTSALLLHGRTNVNPSEVVPQLERRGEKPKAS